ncbi:MAG: NADH:flavin oxidoreductase/NADH oxidase family protein [Deltaproteobacteria bacterium]|nr:NADH:flavin oxidoreductase/NADH oxidase family protein [Deltaproteobacteria bacterium]
MSDDLRSVLSSPLPLPCGASLPNRLIKAAMSEVLADVETGAPTDALVRLYERWGRGGAGMLLTGHVIVDPDGRGEPGNVLVTDRRHLAMLRRWAQAAQASGTQLWMQINHAGRQAPRHLVAEPVAPSAVPMRGFVGTFAKPRALRDDEIHAIVTRFATTAAVAKEAGFAGVQIHGAHGYLVSQFLSPLTNRRDDAWGGDPARRRAFLLALVRAIRAAVGPAFPIGVKLNSADFQRGGFTPEESIDVARALDAAGIDLLEVSGGTYERPAMAGNDGVARKSTVEREAYFLEYARAIRAAVKVPVLLTGGMRTASTMSAAIAEGAIDAVGLARPMTHEPDLPARLLSGAATEARRVEVRSRIRKIDDMAQVFWFQHQIHRMAAGLDPDPTLGVWRAVALGVHGMLTGRPAVNMPAVEPARLLEASGA